MPQSAMVSATRPMSWRAEVSRSGVPTPPRKYFETTTFVAIWDHERGISTPFCSKITSPLPLTIEASRLSQRTSSRGLMPGVVLRRAKGRPRRGGASSEPPSVASVARDSAVSDSRSSFSRLSSETPSSRRSSVTPSETRSETRSAPAIACSFFSVRSFMEMLLFPDADVGLWDIGGDTLAWSA